MTADQFMSCQLKKLPGGVSRSPAVTAFQSTLDFIFYLNIQHNCSIAPEWRSSHRAPGNHRPGQAGSVSCAGTCTAYVCTPSVVV